ncbi:hypothetical protein [Tenacibaculum piscium]|uniref:hypothetical protein n=1 Tax=Tenacibaculum piscium TaxID=1458515 RepID=UPI001F29C6D2|nr:hypothetical protein [Tenacibaculum piscium]
MRKAILSFLQIKSIKNASSLATDGKGNVIAGKKSDEKEIDLSKYQLKPKVIKVDITTPEFQLTNEYVGNILYYNPTMPTVFTVDENTIPEIGDAITLVKPISMPIDLKELGTAKIINNGSGNTDGLWYFGFIISGKHQFSPYALKVVLMKISATEYLITGK